MILPMIFQVLLPKFIMEQSVQYLSPSFVVSEAFRKLLLGNIFTIEIGIMLVISILLFFVTRWKVNYDWRMGR